MRSTISPTPQKRGPCAALSGSRAARPRCSKLTAAPRRRRVHLRWPSPSSTQLCPTSFSWAAALMPWPAALQVRCCAFICTLLNLCRLQLSKICESSSHSKTLGRSSSQAQFFSAIRANPFIIHICGAVPTRNKQLSLLSSPRAQDPLLQK